MHFGPFQQGLFVAHALEIVDRHEAVFATVFFAGTRRARVVQETESRMEGSCWSRALTRLDLPAPLGATTMKTFPELACMNR